MSKKGRSRVLQYIIGVSVILVVLVLLNVRMDIPVETLSKEYTNEHSFFMDIDGTLVHYRDEGQGEPLMLIHGWSSSLHTWDVWVEELKDDFRIIRLDLPGFGLTGPAGEVQYTQDFYIDIVDKLLTELEIEETHMGGNSLGGYITWGFAHRYPDKVKKIILLNAAGYPSEDRSGGTSIFSHANLPGVKSIIRYVTPEFALRFFVNQVYGDTDKVTDDVVRRYHRMVLREGNRDVMFKMLGDRAGSLDASRVPEYLSEIEAPALIMWGDLDSWIPLENAYGFDKNLPNSSIIVYEGAGHIPMEEIPHETARDARTFLLGDR